MRKDNKFNRLTWKRKVTTNKKHPIYTKELQREMYLDKEITVEDVWEVEYMNFVRESMESEVRA